jgi:hypothetical protein
MRQRQEILTKILIDKFGIGKYYPNSVELTVLSKAGIMNEMLRTYRKLDGILDVPPLSFGKWDICLNGFIVELDEEQHFNRYRAATLESYIYHMEKGFDIIDYVKYCTDYETNCLKKASWGKYWTSPSTEKQFGLQGIYGDLGENGSPRWKQRAFYDYLRDVVALVNRIPLIRISVYDRVITDCQINTVGSILMNGTESDLDQIVKFIESNIDKVI